MKLITPALAGSLVFVCNVCLVSPVFSATPDETPVQVSLPLDSVELPDNGVIPPNRPALHLTLQDGSSLTVPIAADVCLEKGKTDPEGGGGFWLRSNGTAVALLKPDLSAVPKGAVVQAASLSLNDGWQMRPGNAEISIHRALTDWTEDATFTQPTADAAHLWSGGPNGLAAAKDYVAAADATFIAPQAKAGSMVSVDGLDGLVRSWLDGTNPNYGFALLLKGSVGQINFDGRDAASRIKPVFDLGGPNNGKIILRPNLPLLERVLYQPGDLQDVSLTISASYAQHTKAVPGTKLTLSVLPSTAPGVAPQSLTGTPVASVPADAIATDHTIEIPGLTREILSELAQSSPGSQPTWLLSMDSPGATPETIQMAGMGNGKTQPVLQVTMKPEPHALLFDNSLVPRPGVYTTAVDGHLTYGGQRLRLWGCVGFGTADRMRKMGFNAQRVWEPRNKFGPGEFLGDTTVTTGDEVLATKGDGSRIDLADQHFADLKAHGMFVMFGALANGMPIKPLLVDNSFIAGGPDWPAWKAAMLAEKSPDGVARYAVFFDDRLQKAKIKWAVDVLNHVNLYTGKKYAEDENIACYEVWNENGMVHRALETGLNLPPYFTNEATQEWNAWLTAKYKDDAGLKAAWGDLKPGESLTGGTVAMAPTLAQRDQYPVARAADYIRFLCEKVDTFNQKFRATCRAQAPAGVGVNVVPFSFDTEYRPSLQWPFVSSRGDVNSFGMYFWGLKSNLDQPPAMYVMDSHTVDGNPTIIYETNQGRPSPQRSEYPLRVATFASWQDWDGVFWHYWASDPTQKDEDFLTGPMPQVGNPFFWTGVENQNDPVMTASMAAGGRIFLGHDVHPAPNPVIYQAGAKAIYSFDNFNGVGMSRTAFTQGARLSFAPDKDTGVVASQPDPTGPISDAVAGGDQILYDWPHGRMIVDTPNALVYAGLLSGSYKFKDGIALGGLNSTWVNFALVSQDGKPLVGPDATQRAYIVALNDARNTGFKFNYNVAGGPVDQAKAIADRGHGPVIVDPVSYKLWFPTALTGHLTAYDFALRTVADQPISTNEVAYDDKRETWITVLDLAGRGAPAIVPEGLGYVASTGPAIAQGPATLDPRLVAVPNPILNLSWANSYDQTHKTLREETVTYTSISPEDLTAAAQKSIVVTGSTLLFNAEGNIEVRFQDGKMNAILVTFTKPPAQQALSNDQTVESHATWVARPAPNGPAGTPAMTVSLSQAQGEMKLSYEVGGE